MKYALGAIILSSSLLCSCSSVGNSVKGFGKDVITVLPGQDIQTEFKAEDYARISQEEEFWLGRAVAGRILSIYKPNTNPELNEYIAKVGQAVVKFSGRPDIFGGYSFQILESDELNALSAPGGFIFITTGLLKTLRGEDDLAAILAHEVAHVQQQHGLSAIKQADKSKGLSVGGTIAGAINCSKVSNLINAAFEAAVDDIVNTLLEKGYSREQEFEADKIAYTILNTSGYEPAGLGNALNELKATNEAGGWFSTHPSPDERLSELGLSVQKPQAIGTAERLNRFPHL